MTPHKKSLKNICLWIAIFLLLWLALVQTPDYSLTPQLDPSWHGTLSYVTANEFQFGKEIIFTFGPLGYLYSIVYSGYLLESKIIADLLTKAIFALLVVIVAQKSGKFLAFFFPINILLYSFFLSSFVDSLFFFAITLLVSLSLLNLNFRPLYFAVPTFLAFSSLIKISFLMVSIVGLFSIVVFLLWHRQWLTLGLFIGTYLIIFWSFWIIAGQDYLGVVSYLHAGMEVSTGYEKAMFLNEPIHIFLVGLIILLITATALLTITILGRKERQKCIVGLLFGVSLFLSWKHGFVRADNHVISFFLFVQFTLVTALSLGNPPIAYRKMVYSLVLFGIALTYLGIFLSLPDYYNLLLPIRIWNRIVQNAMTLTRISDYSHSLEKKLMGAKRQYSLPETKKIAGQKPVDVFGHEQGIALLNDLHYRPRPVFQGYSAYTPFLVKANQDFYESDSAPQFILFKLQTIDGRFAAADDSGALESILLNYTPIIFENGYFLWEIREGPRIYTLHQLIEEGVAAFGDNLDLPIAHRVVWLKVLWETSGLGKLREFLYKPAEVTLEITTAPGQTESYRLVSPLARTGFLLSPHLRDTADVIDLLSGIGERRPMSFRLKVSNATRRLFHPQFRYELYAAPDFPVWTTTPEGAWKIKYWMFGNAPKKVEAILPAEPISVDGQDALSAHAPSQIVFEIPKSRHTIEGRFGIAPGAYERGHTDGVEFSVEMIDSQQNMTVLFRRYLQPLIQPQDRGAQFFSLSLPKSARGQITLRATIGPRNDGAWDWSYWTDVRFK